MSRERRRPRRTLHHTITLVGLSLLLGGGRLAAQLPEEFTNLEVLPEDIDQRTLINYMRSFAIGLGVRCTHCHVGEEGQPFSTYDFASDSLEPKNKARTMMRMVQAINGEHLTGIDGHEEANNVTCATCHRGLPVPRMLEDVLSDNYRDAGIDSTVALYRALRERFYGSYSYDFGEGTLNDVANRVSETSLDDAMTVLELNQEFFPRSPQIHYLMGEVHLADGDREGALAEFRTAVEIWPQHREAQRRIRQLTN